MRGHVFEDCKYTHRRYIVEDQPLTLDDDRSMRYSGYKVKMEKCTNPHRCGFSGGRVINYWNTLTADVVQSASLKNFKARLDRYWEVYGFLCDKKCATQNKLYTQPHVTVLSVLVSGCPDLNS